MNEQERMEEIFKENSQIGRHRLAAAAAVPPSTARAFLDRSKNPQIVRKEKAKAAPTKTIKDPFDNLSPHEKKLILDSLKSRPSGEATNYKWSKESFKFAYFTDPHWGHMLSKLEHWQRACELIEAENCELALCSGDITEGMSGRDGHFYELEAVGATAQLNLAVQRINMLSCPLHGINGNHDLWGYKKLGHDVAAALQDRLPGKFFNLGMHEADFMVGKIHIKLWHGEDGASYATSYRTQKFIEGLSGGEKPHILLAGHDHKSIFHVCRNVMVFGGGTMCGQTMWMRNKKLAAHVGFWIIELWPNENGLERIKSEWIPFYK